MLPAVDPVTVAVVGALVVFTILNRLRWHAKLAWLRRVQLEHQARVDEDDETQGESDDSRREGDDSRTESDDPRGAGEGTRRQDDDPLVEDDGTPAPDDDRH